VELQFAGLEKSGDSEDAAGEADLSADSDSDAPLEAEGELATGGGDDVGEQKAVSGLGAGEPAVAAAEAADDTTEAPPAEGVDGGEPDRAASDTVVTEGTSR
jgi:hypothetical protein